MRVYLDVDGSGSPSTGDAIPSAGDVSLTVPEPGSGSANVVLDQIQ